MNEETGAMFQARMDARAIADRNGITDVDGMRRILAWVIERRIREAIKPWQDAKAKFYAMLIPTITKANDGPLEYHYDDLTPAQQSYVAQLDELIAHEYERFGMSPPDQT